VYWKRARRTAELEVTSSSPSAHRHHSRASTAAMDIYERRKPANSEETDARAPAPSRGRAKRSKPMPLAMLHSGALDAVTAAPMRAAAPAASSTASTARTAATRFSAAQLPPTSLALCLQYCSLRGLLSAARTCRSWQSAARMRLAWSEGRHFVSVQGSREELRHLGTDAQLEAQVRNFNPLLMHATSSTPVARAIPAVASSHSQEALPLQRLCRTSLLHHVRHLRYRFASPSIRTSIALHSDDVFATDVVTSRFPLQGLPRGSLPFLASLSLEDVTACSQPTLQSAFQALGVQEHSHLRALRLVASPVLSDAETLRTLRAVLAELPANLVRLEVLHLPQRNLPPELPFDGFLSLTHLHTLLLDESCTKTAARLHVVRSMALHGALQHLHWPAWRPSHMRMMFGGVRRAIEEEEEEARALASDSAGLIAAASASLAAASLDSLQLDPSSSGTDGAAPPFGDEAILGLDDEENEASASAQLGGRPSEQACFGFTEWTIDRDVIAANLVQYFACRPTLLPAVHTLSFAQPGYFATMLPTLPVVLPALPALTALRITVPHFGLGSHFWSTLASLHLPSLRQLQLDQVSLVLLHSADAASHGIDLTPSSSSDLCTPGVWSAFPGLEDLCMRNMTLPPSEGLAAACPRLRQVELCNVSMAAVGSGSGVLVPPAASAALWIEEMAALPRLAQLALLHCADVEAGMLVPLAHCRMLERLRFCSHALSASHSHALSRAATDAQWGAPSLRHFDFLPEDEAGTSIGGGSASASRPGLVKQSSGGSGAAGGAASQARALSWLHQRMLALQRQQQQLHAPTHSDVMHLPPPARMRISYCDEAAREQMVQALPPPQH